MWARTGGTSPTWALTYRGLSGDRGGRSRLYQAILESAQTRQETLNSDAWTVKIISTRLRNALAAQNNEAEE